MESKQIVVITFSLSNNGAERVFTELSNEWVKQKHSVTVIQFEKNAFGSESFELDPRVEAIILSHKDIHNKIRRYLTYMMDIRRYLKIHRDAIVIAYSFTTQIIVAITSLFLNINIIFSERNDPGNCPYSSIARKIRNLSYYRAKLIVFQTEEAKRYFSKSIQKRGTIIANPINPSLPGRYIGKRRNVIVTAARLRPQKNLSMLIEAFALFHKQYSDYILEIYGIGEEKGKLEKLAMERGILEYVHFMGFCVDVDEKMNDAVMYVCSSDYEGISNSMLEAIAMGIPTISTDCPIGGARQTIKDHESGILVPVGDVMAMYGAMVEIVKDKELYAKLSTNGYKIREDNRVEKIAKQWVKCFDED